MKPSSFQEAEKWFDYICVPWKTAKELYALSFKVAKREIHTDVGVIYSAVCDNGIYLISDFTLNGCKLVENDLLSEALRELPDKKREILLLFYFMDMSDSEIADLLKLNRSTVYRHRTSGLALIKKFMEEFEE